MTEAGRITAIIDGDISALTSKMAQAKSVATSAASDIEKDFKSKLGSGMSGMGDGLGKSFSSGKFSDAGKKAGEALVDGVSSSFGPLGSAVGEVATALGPTGLIATAAIAGAAIIASSASSAAMEWEAGMSQISKTTGIEKSSAQFNTLSKDLQNLYSQMPTTVSEIQSVATSAGSLGIAQTEIAGFTNIALQMGSAFDIPAEQAAVGVGKIKSQTKSFTDEVKNLDGSVSDSKFAQHFGSAVDYAGNSLNATESDVLDFSTRTAGAFSNLGGDIYELAGWGGELASVFSSSELASGSFNAALNQLMGTTKGSENARAKAGELLGVTPEDFQALMTNDPTDTLLDIGKAMEGLSATEKFQVAGILGGGYGDDFFQKMVGNTDEWRGKIEEVKQAGESGTSIGGSYEAGVENMKAQLEILGNSAGAIFQDIGGPLNAALTPVISSAASGLNSLRTIGENLWGPFTAAISPATTAISALASGVAGIGGISLDGLVAASGAINSGFEIGSAFVSAFGEELSDLITGTETFQELSAAVESFGDTLSGIGDGIGDIAGKISSGLADAIPTALSGAGDAVGTLLDKAGLGGVAEASGDVQDFLGGVYDNAAEKLGWGVEKGTKDGMEAGSEAAKGAITETTTEAVTDAYEAVQTASKEFSAKYGSQYAAGMTQVNGKWVSNQERDSFYKDKSLDSGEYSTFANEAVVWNLLKESASGKTKTLKAVINIDGTEYTREFSTLEDTAESATRKLKDEFRDIVLDIPKYLKTTEDDISGSLTDALSDGVISFTEKDELTKYIELIDSIEATYPIQFEASGLGDVRDQISDTLAGKPFEITVDVNLEQLETNLQIWLQENAGLFEKMAATGTPATQPQAESLHTLLTGLEGKKQETNDPETQEKLQREIDLIDKLMAATESGDVASLGTAHAAYDELISMDSNLLSNTGLQMLANTLNREELTQLQLVNGNLVAIGDAIEAGSFVSASSIINNYGDFGKYASGTDTSSGWKYVAATNLGTYKEGLKNSLAKATYQDGGVTGAEGLAWVHANEVILPSDALPCAVSSMYGVLENPDLFYSTGGIQSTKTSTSSQAVVAAQNSYAVATNQAAVATTKYAIATESAALDIARLGYDSNAESFYYKAPAGYSEKDVKMGRAPADVVAEYKAVQAEIDILNEKLTAAKENYLDCWDISSSYSRWLWQPEQQATLFQGSYIGPSAGYQTWAGAGKSGSIGWDANADLLSGFQEGYASSLFRNTGDVSALVAESKFSQATVASAIKNTEVAKNTNDIAKSSETTALTLKSTSTTWDEINDGVAKQSSKSSGTTAGAGDLAWDGAAGQKVKGSLTEFDAFESGLAKCVEYMSDWGLVQEGILSSELFYGGFEGGYIGKSEYYDPELHSAVSGAEEHNFLSWYPVSQPFADQAAANGLMGTGKTTTETESDTKAIATGVSQLQSQVSELGGTLVGVEQNGSILIGTYETSAGIQEQMAVDLDSINANTAKQTEYVTGGALTAGLAGVSGWFESAKGAYGSVLVQNTVSANPAGDWGTSGNAASWMTAATPGFAWAEGGLADSPEYFMNDGQLAVRGEAGPELILPLSDPARTAELIHQYLPGVRKFARGGLVGGGIGAAISPAEILASIQQTHVYAPVISGSGLSKKEIEDLLEKDHAKFLKELDRLDGLARGRRG